jgi:DNA polymerase III alpha subunit
MDARSPHRLSWSIDKLVKRAKDHGMNALAITDHGNLHGALEFYNKAKGAGDQPDPRLRSLHRPRQPV